MCCNKFSVYVRMFSMRVVEINSKTPLYLYNFCPITILTLC